MKTNVIIRTTDHLGRVVLPSALRYLMNINQDDFLEFFVDEESIILKKYMRGCIFCKNAEELKDIQGKIICQSCLKELKELA